MCSACGAAPPPPGSARSHSPARAPAPALAPQDFETFLEPIFALFKAQRRGDETLGDFTARVGFPALRDAQAAYVAPPPPAAVPTVQLGIPQDVYDALSVAAAKQGSTPEAVATEAIRKHLHL